jgi:SPP1 gp7 family putative phage head morphogenesis protein
MFSFNLSPEKNLEYLLSKKPELHYNYDEIMFEAHHKAFTVAKVTKADLLLDIQTSLLKAQKDGKSFENWQKELKPTLQKKGWWGEKQQINPKTGEVREYKVGSRRLKTIYRTNMATMDAQTRANEQYASSAEYLRYVAVMDSRTRDEHKALHGLILHRDNSFWSKNYPPNGWNCRCKTFAYTKRQIEKHGWKISESGPKWFKADKDWSYDTRNLQGEGDSALVKAIEHKVERILNVNDPDKIIRSYLKESLQEIGNNRKLYEKVKKLYDASIGDDKKLFDKKTIVIAATTQKLKEQLNTDAKEIFLSGETIRTHTHHDNIYPFDYSLIKYILKKDYKYKPSGENHIVYFSKLGKYYRAVFKKAVNKNGTNEIFLVSLLKSGKKL